MAGLHKSTFGAPCSVLRAQIDPKTVSERNWFGGFDLETERNWMNTDLSPMEKTEEAAGCETAHGVAD